MQSENGANGANGANEADGADGGKTQHVSGAPHCLGGHAPNSRTR